MNSKYGYYHGRFQPFHNGHFEMVKLMLENHDEIIIGLSNPFRVPVDKTKTETTLVDAILTEDTRNPANNPWPYWQRMLMIRDSLKIEGYDPARVIFIPNLIASGFDVNETEFPKNEVVTYTMPSGKHNKVILENDKLNGHEVVVIDPKERIISGTKMRELLEENNPEWERFVPKGTAKVIKKYGMNVKE